MKASVFAPSGLMSLHITVPLCLCALCFDAIVGYRDPVYRVIGHPVTWMAELLNGLDRQLNRPWRSEALRRGMGTLALLITLGITSLVTLPLDLLLPQGVLGFSLLVVITASLPAQSSLHVHLTRVIHALRHQGLEGGRNAVGMIVGRDTDVLDTAGVARAAIESLAESFSDGVVAPAFWIALGGLTGGALYKAANTADSMFGHRNARYEDFGWASARFDDLVNLPAARLAALLIVVAAWVGGESPRGAWRVLWRDARLHRSPNAGWPEAAMAGALRLKLGGPRVYDKELVDDAYLGDGRYNPTVADIRRALKLYHIACGLQLVIIIALALLVARW